MTLFGTEKWLARGEAFSVYFGMFSSLAPLEVRDGRLGVRRRALGGATRGRRVPGSVALVLVTIGATTFDGAGEGAAGRADRDGLRTGSATSGWARWPRCGSPNSIFLAITLAFVAGALLGRDLRACTRCATQLSTRRLRRGSSRHAFIPIALAYLVAHYFSLVVFQEQAQFTFLLSDPLGDGSDLFGTATSGIDYAAISSNAIWYVQVGGARGRARDRALVLGHDRALKVYGDPRPRRARSTGCWR